MTRSVGEDYARGSPPPGLLRGAGMVLAVVLGAIAIWLIVTSDTLKGTRVGALIGFWALLLAAFAVFGTRHPITAFTESMHGQAGGGVTRLEDAAARREHELRVAEMLRREIEVAMGSQIATLRAEVSALREQLVETGGGQMRLERIETTRVVGSDFDAMQQDVRHLVVAREPDDAFSAATAATTQAATYGPAVEERPAPIQADLFAPEPFAGEQPSAFPLPRPEPVTRPEPPASAPLRPHLRAVRPGTGPAPKPAHEPTSLGGPEQWIPKTFASLPLPVLPDPPALPSSNGRQPPPLVGGDPFASMPRLRPADPEMFASLPLPVLPPEPPAPPSPPSAPSSNGRQPPPLVGGDPFASMPRLRPADPEMFASLPLPVLPPAPPSSNGRKWPPPIEPPANGDPFASMPRLRPADPEMFASLPLPVLPTDPPVPNGRKRPAIEPPVNDDPFASLPRLRPHEPNVFRSLPLPALPGLPTEPPTPAPPAPNGRRRPPSEPAVNGDPFAAMPRLRPFSDDAPDPVDSPSRWSPPAGRSRPQDAATSGAIERTGTASAGDSDAADEPGGRGRTGSSPSGNGRHATGATPRQIDPHHTGGRRRSSGANDDVLARILRREEPPSR